MGRVLRRAALAAALALAVALAAGACLLAGCSGGVSIDSDSPTVADVSFSVSSSMTEASQQIQIRLEFDEQISVSGDASGDFEVLLNGEAIDGDAIALEVGVSGEAITFTLSPAEGASAGPSGGSTYFAVYSGQISISAAREDGALPHVTGASGSNAVLDEAVEGTLPSGLAIEVVSTTAGSEADNTLAQTTFRVTSPALVRCITWFSPDGGETLLLKHNHQFASADAQDCAEDLADVVNAASGLGLVAASSGDTVTLMAQEVVDGQVIEPLVVEGAGVAGGDYDESEDAEEGAL